MDLNEAIKKAIMGEVEGRELYKTAAEKSDDKKAKAVFRLLAEEEDSHIKTLKTIYKSIINNEEIELPQLKKQVDLKSSESPIFSENFKKRLKGKHFEMSALSIGVRLEMDSFRFYSDMAEKAENPLIRDLFKQLSEWEKTHYDALLMELDSLQEEYFIMNRFEPF